MIKNKKQTKKTKILAVNFGGIGDEILFFPTLKTLKTLYPASSLTLVLEPRSKSAKELTSLIDEVITCDIKGKPKYLNIIKLLFRIFLGRYDIVISSGSAKSVAILLFLTGIRKRFGYNTGWLSKILLTKTVPLNKNQYAVGMYHDLTGAIKSNQECGLPEIDISQKNLLWANQKIGDRGGKQVITIHPGVSKLSVEKNMIKFWAVQNWTDLIVKLVCSGKYKVILTGGPDDEGTLLQIKAKLAEYDFPKENLTDLCGQTRNISQLAAVISLSDLLVCVDSAPMHLAVGVQSRVAVIFGPTDDRKLLPPNDQRFVAIKKDHLDCRPCLWEKRQSTCAFINCMDITSAKVFEVIEKALTEQQ